MNPIRRKQTSRRCFAGITAAALALIFAAAAPTLMLTSPASAGSPIVHEVLAGGPDVCAAFDRHPGCDGNMTITATMSADGSVSGTLTDRFGSGEGARGDIDCLAVEGNRAWVSGALTRDFAGLYFIAGVQDNGTSANDPADQLIWILAEEPFDCTAPVDLNLLDAPQGQVTVR